MANNSPMGGMSFGTTTKSLPTMPPPKDMPGIGGNLRECLGSYYGLDSVFIAEKRIDEKSLPEITKDMLKRMFENVWRIEARTQSNGWAGAQTFDARLANYDWSKVPYERKVMLYARYLNYLEFCGASHNRFCDDDYCEDAKPYEEEIARFRLGEEWKDFTLDIKKFSDIAENAKVIVFDKFQAKDAPSYVDVSDISMSGKKQVVSYWEDDTLHVTHCVAPYRCNRMFMGCSKLKQAYLHGLDCEFVVDCASMFRYCENLEYINFTNTALAPMNTSYMFADCSSLNTIIEKDCGIESRVLGLDFRFVFNADSMYSGCKSIVEPVGWFRSLVSADEMFKGCESMEECDCICDTSCDLSRLKSAAFMFEGCINLAGCYGAFTALENATGMFEGCVNFEEFYLDCNSSSLVYISSMFKGCTKLTKITHFDLDLSHVIAAEHAFDGCENLKEAEFLKLGMHSCKTIEAMYKDCKSIKQAVVNAGGDLYPSGARDLFEGCSSLTDIKLHNSLTEAQWDDIAQSARRADITTLRDS